MFGVLFALLVASLSVTPAAAEPDSPEGDCAGSCLALTNFVVEVLSQGLGQSSYGLQAEIQTLGESTGSVRVQFGVEPFDSGDGPVTVVGNETHEFPGDGGSIRASADWVPSRQASGNLTFTIRAGHLDPGGNVTNWTIEESIPMMELSDLEGHANLTFGMEDSNESLQSLSRIRIEFLFPDEPVASEASSGPGQGSKKVASVPGEPDEDLVGPPSPLDPPTDPVDRTPQEWASYGMQIGEETYDAAVVYWPRSLPAIETGGTSVGGYMPLSPLDNPFQTPDLFPGDPPPSPTSRYNLPLIVASATAGDASGEMTPQRSAGSAFRVSAEPGTQGLARVEAPASDPFKPDGGLNGATPSKPDQEEPRDLSPGATDLAPVSPDRVAWTALAGILGAGLGVGLALGTLSGGPAAGGFRWFMKIFSSLGFARLFSRTTGPAVLKHQLRQQIYNKIAEEPGLTIIELAQLLNVHRSTIRHHLGVLKQEGIVHMKDNGKFRHIYLNEPKSAPARVPANEALFYRHRGKIARAVLDQPGIVQKRLAKEIGLPPSRIGPYTQILKDAGLVTVERSDRFVRYFPTSLLANLDNSAFREQGVECRQATA